MNTSTPAKSFLMPTLGAGVSLTIFNIKGAPWYLVRDLMGPLGYPDEPSAVQNLSDDEKGTHTISTPRGTEEATTVNEAGLYSLFLNSPSPVGKAYRKWLTSIVLPALRRDGGYLMGEELRSKGPQHV